MNTNRMHSHINARGVKGLLRLSMPRHTPFFLFCLTRYAGCRVLTLPSSISNVFVVSEISLKRIFDIFFESVNGTNTTHSIEISASLIFFAVPPESDACEPFARSKFPKDLFYHTREKSLRRHQFHTTYIWKEPYQ